MKLVDNIGLFLALLGVLMNIFFADLEPTQYISASVAGISLVLFFSNIYAQSQSQQQSQPQSHGDGLKLTCNQTIIIFGLLAIGFALSSLTTGKGPFSQQQTAKRALHKENKYPKFVSMITTMDRPMIFAFFMNYILKLLNESNLSKMRVHQLGVAAMVGVLFGTSLTDIARYLGVHAESDDSFWFGLIGILIGGSLPYLVKNKIYSLLVMAGIMFLQYLIIGLTTGDKSEVHTVVTQEKHNGKSHIAQHPEPQHLSSTKYVSKIKKPVPHVESTAYTRHINKVNQIANAPHVCVEHVHPLQLSEAVASHLKLASSGNKNEVHDYKMHKLFKKQLKNLKHLKHLKELKELSELSEKKEESEQISPQRIEVITF